MTTIFRLMLFALLLIVGGCATNTQNFSINGNNNEVKCTGSVDKPVDFRTAIKGNVPLQGGSVDDSGANVAQ